MSIETLRQSFLALNTKYQSLDEPTSLQDKIQLAYSKWVLNRLEQIIDENPESLPGKFELFLNNNWAFVNGTPLSPTALPTNDIILFLCDIAEWTTSHSQDKTPIVLLMPTIATESCRTKYPDLNIASTIRDVLKTHVSGLGGLYLLPVALLTELQLSAETIRLANPYYDYQIHPETAGFINPDEYKRLIGHSELTQALFDARCAYELLTSDTNTLLGQLKLLCQRLGFNSVYAAGTEDDAGMGAYPAIIYFMEYYNKLADREKDKIPAHLKQEIDTLVELSTNREKNRKATDIMATCIATRRSELIKHMMGHEVILNQISLGHLENTNLIDAAKLGFEEARRELLEAMASHRDLNGFDKPGMSIVLFNKLDVPIQMTTPADLALFQTLTPDEITMLCSQPEFRRQVIHQIETIDNLIIFIISLSPDNLKSFLNSTERELKEHFFESYRDLRSMLISLDVEKCYIVCEALQNILPSIFDGVANGERLKGGDLGHVLFALLPQQRIAVCQAMKKVFPDIIHSTRDLRDILRFVTPEESAEIIQSIKIPAIIHSREDLRAILEWITFEEYIELIQSTNISDVLFSKKMVDVKLPSPHNESVDSDELLPFIRSFSPEQCVAVLQAIGFKRIETEFNLDDLLTVGANKFSLVCKAINEGMPEYSACTDCEALFNALTLKQCAMACFARQQNFSEMSILDFSHLLCSIPIDKMTVVCKLSIKNVVRSPSDISELLSVLSLEQCRHISDSIPYPSYSDPVSDWIQLLQPLSLDKKTLIYEENRLYRSINSVGEFVQCTDLAALFPEPLCMELFEWYSRNLSAIIKSVDDLGIILKSLSPEHNIVVLQQIKRKLPTLISSSLDFAKACSYLTSEECAKFCQKMCDTLPNLIQSADDIQIMTPYFTLEKTDALLPVLSLPYLVTSLKACTSNKLVVKLASALLSNDNARIKRDLDQLMQHDNFADMSLYSFFMEEPKRSWIDVLPDLDACWLEKINAALALGLTDLQLCSLVEVKHALEEYSNLDSRFQKNK